MPVTYRIQIPSMYLRCICITFMCMTIINKVLPTPITFESFDFSIQITVPITTEVPTFLLGRKYKTPYQYGQPPAYYRNKRSLEDEIDETKEMETNALNGIFSHLGLHKAPCQQKLICLITQNPEKYSPLTQVVFRQLNTLQDEWSRGDMNISSTNWQYMEYLNYGTDLYSPMLNCTQRAASCREHPDENIDWNTIKAWQELMNFVKVEFKDSFR